MLKKKYLKIAEHYEYCLGEHGDNHLGVGWNNEEDVNRRFRVMLELLAGDNSQKIKLLDFGCGTAHLYEYIKRNHFDRIAYSGSDISEKFIHVARKKYPGLEFYHTDILEDSSVLPVFDYVAMNGVFTQKRELDFDEMFSFFTRTIEAVFPKAQKGIAFNVMSKQVDWENEGNFYLSFDQLAQYLAAHISKKFVFRNDYGLYEYTTYVYKNNAGA